MTYKVVCDVVIPEPIPSKLRLGSTDGAKVEFLQRTISIIGAYSDLERDTLYVAVLRQLFILSHRWRRVRTPHNVSIPIRLCVEIPQGPIPPIPVALKPSNVPPNSLAVSRQSKSGVLSPTVCPLKLNCARTLTPVFPQGDTTGTKTVESSQLLPTSLYPFRLRRGR